MYYCLGINTLGSIISLYGNVHALRKPKVIINNTTNNIIIFT